MFKTGDRVKSLADQAVGRVTEVDGSVIRVTFDDGSVDWFSAPKLQLTDVPIGTTRNCPDCGRPQHYTGTEHGWAHDALILSDVAARSFRAVHDDEVRQLTRTTKAELARIEAAELAKRGTQRVYGGPGSKDELIRSIIDMRYPRCLMDESNHVLYHKPGENWSACAYCQVSA